MRLDGTRLADALGRVVCVAFTLATGWEIFGPPPLGHFGAAYQIAIAGENVFRWHAFAPVERYLDRPPVPTDVYAHHPYGLFWAAAAAYAVVGHRWLAVRLAALVMSGASIVLARGIARRHWGAEAGLAAALGFALTPVNLAFSNFPSLEVNVIFWGLLFTWASLRTWQGGRGADLALAVLGAVGVVNADWIGFVLVGLVLGFAGVRAYVAPRAWVGPIRERSHATWFAATSSAVALVGVAYLHSFLKHGYLADLFASFGSRTSGQSSLEDALLAISAPRRHMWIQWTVPPVAFVPIVLSAPLLLVRRAPADGFVWAWLVAASVQYFLFKQGADIHIFWPHLYAVPIALGAGSAAGGAAYLVRGAGARRSPIARRAARVGAWGFGVAGAALAVVLARIAIAALWQSHLTSGQFDEGGYFISSRRDATTVAKWVADTTPREVPIRVERAVHGPHVEYAVGRPIEDVAGIRDARGGVVLLDARTTSVADLREAMQYEVDLVGPFLRVDRRVATGVFRARRFVARAPGPLEFLTFSGTAPVFRVEEGEDPWLAWAWRVDLGLPAAAPEGEPPDDLEHLRIAHDVALERRDAPRAAGYLARVEAQLTHRLDVAFDRGITLVGARLERGVASTTATLLWRTADDYQAFAGDFHVRSRVVRPPPLWPSVVDHFEKEIAHPGSARPDLWRPGRLHAQRFEILERVGHEVYGGHFTANTGAAPRPTSGAGAVPLFEID